MVMVYDEFILSNIWNAFKHGCNVFPLYTKVVSSVREKKIILSGTAGTGSKSKYTAALVRAVLPLLR